MYSTKNGKRGSSRRNRNAGASRRSIAPPSFNATVVVRKKLRFEASSAGSNVQIIAAELFDLLCMATGATAAYQLMSSVRLRRVQIWGPMASDLKPVTVAVEWSQPTVGGLTSPQVIVSDTSMGAMRAAYVSAKPPPNSQASMWLNRVSSSGTLNVMQLTFPANSVIDLDLEFVLQNGQTPVAVAAAVAGATVGAVYCRDLDSSGSAIIVPVSYVTI